MVEAILERRVIEEILTHPGLQARAPPRSVTLCRSKPPPKTASSTVRCRVRAVMTAKRNI
jgi:hypothetical protein